MVAKGGAIFGFLLKSLGSRVNRRDAIRSAVIPWFCKVVRAIRLLRIEKRNELLSAIEQHELQFFPPTQA
jgi:hypothetical protein